MMPSRVYQQREVRGRKHACFWISERVRSNAGRSPCGGAARADGQRRPPHDADDPAFKRRKRCGGAWRAFLREQATSNLRRAAEEYRNLGPAERERLREIGVAATRDGRAGRAEGASFGLPRREAERRHKQRLALARIQRLSAEMAGVSVDTVLALAAQDTDPALMSVQLCRHSRALAATERATLDDDVRAIQSFQEANNNVVAATIIAAAPTLAPIAHSVCAVPPCDGGNRRGQLGRRRLCARSRRFFALVHSLEAHAVRETLQRR